jgi:putative pre-16S rRNA nuclease
MGLESDERGRVLALDLGARRTGIALSDESASLASPLETVELPLKRLIAHIRELIVTHNVATVVVGLPRLPSGDLSEIGSLAYEVARRLEINPQLQVVLWDETLTSWEAEELLRAQGRGRPADGRKRRRGKYDPGEVDRVAASLILQDYLERHRKGDQ